MGTNDEVFVIGCHALGISFGLETNHPGVAAYLERAFAGLSGGNTKGARLSLHVAPDGLVTVTDQSATVVCQTADAALGLETLVRSANQLVFSSAQDHLLLHGAWVQRSGSNVLLLGASESGKSTLATGLLRDGWAYGTDDVVAIEPASGLVTPYPRPLCLDPGSHILFPDLQPASPTGLPGFLDRQWHLAAADVSADVATADRPVQSVVFTHYDAMGATELYSIHPAAALVRLLESSFRIGLDGFEPLARSAAAASCHHLVVSDLDDAVMLLRDLPEDDHDVSVRFLSPAGPHVAPDVRTVVLEDESVLARGTDGAVLHLNEAATFVWTHIVADTPRDTIASAIAHSTGIEVETAKNDVDSLLLDLVAGGFLRPESVVA